MRTPPKLRRHEAEQQATEARKWQCESCPKMIEDGQDGPHCRYCADYWNDVAGGMFDDW